MRTEWSNKDSLEIPEITAGYGSVSWSDYKTGTSCDSVVLPTVQAIPIEWIENWKRGKSSIEQVVADKIMMDYKYRDYWEEENDRNQT